MRSLLLNSVFGFLRIIVGNIKKIYGIRFGPVMLTFILFGPYLLSCSKDGIPTEEFPKKTKTTVRGRVYDVERNRNVPDFKRHLIRSWPCTSVVQAAICSETVDSTRTDENGRYEFVFDYIHDGKRYGFNYVSENPYRTESLQDYDSIIPGEVNIIDVNAWKPVTIRLNLQVSNNDHPPLNVNNKVIATGYSHFAHESIYEKDKDTTVYILSKPNSRVRLNFYYSTGYSNGNYHSFKDTVQTTLQDTISFDYTIDCSKF